MPTLRHLVRTARVTREWVEGNLFPLCESLRSRAQAVCYNANKTIVSGKRRTLPAIHCERAVEVGRQRLCGKDLG